MGWEITDSWDNLQGVNTGHSEELANGKVAFWRTEDWEIYGPGGGGYTSAGPFDSVEDDLQAWIASGSLLAQDVINWHENSSTSSGGRPNFNKWQQASLTRRAGSRFAIACSVTPTHPTRISLRVTISSTLLDATPTLKSSRQIFHAWVALRRLFKRLSIK